MFVPLCAQLGFLGFLLHLQFESERIIERANHAAAVDEQIKDLGQQFLESSSRWEWQSDIPLGDEYFQSKQDIFKALENLKQLLASDPQQVRVVGRFQTTAESACKLMESNRLSTAPVDTRSPEYVMRKRAFKGLKAQLARMVADELIEISRGERRIVEESPALQAKNRTQTCYLIATAAVFNVFIALAFALFFNRDVVRRLAIIFDNSVRLAKGQPLNPIAGGSDEIARLDQVFHDMTEALKEAERKKLLVIEEARDLICSLDERGIFLTVSPASRELIGYAPEELVGAAVADIVLDADRKQVEGLLRKAVSGENEDRFETRLVRKDGEVIDALFSLHWSEAERSLFCIVHDISERKRAERLRQYVMQMVSHDIRTPLTTVRAVLDTLQSGVVGDLNDKGLELINVADQSSLRILNLVRDLLEVEKMEGGTLQLERAQLDLQDVLDEAVDSVSGLAQKRQVKVQCDPVDISLFADSGRLVQVIVNLLGNAIKFSRSGGTVRLTASQEAGNVQINIIDQGRGIPASKLSSIFERFAQVEASDAKQEGGTGLGLAICKALVELHGGEIWVVSEEGTGSTFSFRIPLEGVPAVKIQRKEPVPRNG